ncbi:outer membrane beta-barrel protein [Alcanivorax sp. JB21]|uniref:OmpW/AlkL family protein n=1 Tax=Alcanivorax limicola TaxID=2874102 RepID=UPI001CBD472D|nr:OmpW family outer membrane protein [Alcanivorax limicola]MBZ2189684.1 outer membrane beta-barrel protein [Alcanivorax limicola]
MKIGKYAQFTLAQFTLVGAAVLFAGSATAADWVVRGGVHHVEPASDNGQAAGMDLEIGNSTRPSVSVTWMASERVGIEVLGAVPFRHKIELDGLGKVGSTRHLPPTVSVQYHFLPGAVVQPYASVGLNYTRFFHTRTSGALAGSKLKLEDSWGLAGQVGVDIPLSERWLVGADVRHMDIDSDVKLDGAKVGKANIDPWAYGLYAGYRF